MITIDAKGMSCPMPVVEIARARLKLKEMETFQVLADDSAFPNDIKAWCQQTGSELKKLETKPKHFEATILVHPVSISLRFGS